MESSYQRNNGRIGGRVAALVAFAEAASGTYVLNTHLPGLTTSPMPMPFWQKLALVLALILAVLPAAIFLTKTDSVKTTARLSIRLALFSGLSLWVCMLGLTAREIPPPIFTRLAVAFCLFVPWMILPTINERTSAADTSRSKYSLVFVWWIVLGSFGLCELVIGEFIRIREWRMLIVESEPYARMTKDERGFYVAPHARWRHVYSSDPNNYFGPQREVIYQANSRGIRNGECSLAKPGDTYRIIALGDSFTLGEGVHFHDTWPQQLQGMLRKRFDSNRIDVVNAGVNAYNTTQELAHFVHNVRGYQPDLVIVAMVWNDSEKGDPGGFGAGFAVSSATLAQYLPLTDRLIRGIAAAIGFDGIANEPEEWRESFDSLRALREEVARDGSELLVSIYPSVRHLGNEALKRVYELQESFCTTIGVECVNSYPVFLRARPQTWHVHEVDNHPNAHAHRVFANKLADRIENKLRSDRNAVHPPSSGV